MNQVFAFKLPKKPEYPNGITWMIRLYSKSERVFSLRTEARSLFTCQMSSHSYSMDQGGFRTFLHIGRYDVKWCFFDLFDFDESWLCGSLPLCDCSLGFWSILGKILANSYKHIEHIESKISLTQRERERERKWVHIGSVVEFILVERFWIHFPKNVHVFVISYLINI